MVAVTGSRAGNISDRMVIILAIWSVLCVNAGMGFNRPLTDILGGRIKVDILRLLSRTRSEHTGREIASIIGCSHNAARYALEGLERSGPVIHRQAGRANTCSLDGDNVVVADILSPPFMAEGSLIEEIANIVSRSMGAGLSSIHLFGSVARGEEDEGSDIDIVVVLRDGADPAGEEEAIADASIEVLRRFGNKLSPLFVTESELERKRRTRKGVWRDIATEGMELKIGRGRP